MKILQIITLAECGGAQAHLLEVIKGLKNKFDFFILVGSEGFLTDELKKIKIPYQVCSNLIRAISPINDFKAILEIVKIIKEQKPDLIHCHSSKAGIIGRLAAFISRTPSIFTAHGWGFHSKVAFIQKNIVLISEVICSWISNQIICVSEFDYKLAIKTKLISKQKLIIIHNGIAALEDPVNNFQLPENLKDKTQILMIGRFAEPKRHDLLIQAFQEAIQQTSKECTLLLLGDGPLRTKCENLVQNLNLTNNIKFLGEISPANAVLQQTNIFALISEREGLPISILEAMRSSLPIIASDVGGINELIQNNWNGYLIQSQEELIKSLVNLIEDINKRKEFSINSKELFESQFTSEIMLEKLKAIYNKKGKI